MSGAANGILSARRVRCTKAVGAVRTTGGLKAAVLRKYRAVIHEIEYVRGRSIADSGIEGLGAWSDSKIAGQRSAVGIKENVR